MLGRALRNFLSVASFGAVLAGCGEDPAEGGFGGAGGEDASTSASTDVTTDASTSASGPSQASGAGGGGGEGGASSASSAEASSASSAEASSASSAEASSASSTSSTSSGPSCACSPGETETASCGMCGSGKKTRACEASCQWGSFGACGGERAFPYDPATKAPACPPYFKPAVFLAAHADDESIGMAAAIDEHVKAGRDVFVEIMTQGEKSGVRSVLGNGKTDAWHGGSHAYALSEKEFGDARTAEFSDAMARLGVKGIFTSDFGDGSLTVSEVGTRVAFWTGLGDKSLSLKGTAGPQDPREPGGTPHPDHAAVWSALVKSGWHDVRGYLVYHYGHGAGSPTGVVQTGSFCAAKKNALGAYKVWKPASGRYAIGYHSVRGLIDAASSKCEEYIVVP